MVGRGDVKGSDGGKSEGGKKLGESRGSRSVWEGKVVDVSRMVEEWGDEFEEGETDKGERGESGSIRVARRRRCRGRAWQGSKADSRLGRKRGRGGLWSW
jgi:hypothetical protein